MSPSGAKYTRRKLQEEYLNSKDTSVVQFGKYLKEGKDIVIINVWRPLREVHDNPLALCRWDSELPQDAKDWGIEVNESSNVIQPWKYREGQRWYFISNQTPDQVYIFMQHDSRASDGHGMNIPHASVALKQDVNKISRRSSFECQVIAIMEPSILETLKKKMKSFF